jgi:hypothetical protein
LFFVHLEIIWTGQRTSQQEADDLIRKEMQAMLMWDAAKYPVPNGPKNARANPLAPIPDAGMTRAHSINCSAIYQKIVDPKNDIFLFVSLDAQLIRLYATAFVINSCLNEQNCKMLAVSSLESSAAPTFHRIQTLYRLGKQP